MPNIIIANEFSVIRKGLISIISNEIENCIVFEAKNFTKLLNLTDSQDTDLIIMDINLQDKSGLYTIKHLKAVSPGVPILLISLRTEEELIKRCLAAGASGYLNLYSEPDEFILAIHNILKGLKYVGSDMISKLVSLLNGPEPEVSFYEKLTDREYEVFRLIGEKKTSTEIADILSLSIKTVSTYKSRILVKLNLNSSQELLGYALENEPAYRNEYNFV